MFENFFESFCMGAGLIIVGACALIASPLILLFNMVSWVWEAIRKPFK